MSTTFHTQDQHGRPLGGVIIRGTSPTNGPWAATTDTKGVFDAGLADGAYTIMPDPQGAYSGPAVSTWVGPVVITLSNGTPVPPPTTDAIDINSVVFTSGTPNVRSWPIGTSLQGLSLSDTVNADVQFDRATGPNAWPFVTGPEGGDIQFTLWPVCQIHGTWYTFGSILCIIRSETDHYVPTGPTLQPSQLPNNWYYPAGAPLATYQPQPGEQVGWFLTAGAQRLGNTFAIQARSQIVLAPFTSGTYAF